MDEWVVIEPPTEEFIVIKKKKEEPPAEEFIIIKKTPFTEPVWGKVVNKN